MDKRTLLILIAAAIVALGILAGKGFFGPTGTSDPCVDLDGSARQACLDRR